MGYYINSRGSEFVIKAANQAPALTAIKAAAALKASGKVKAAFPSNHWSWIDMDKVQACKTLREFLEEARWEPSIRGEKFEGGKTIFDETVVDAGDITALEFTGEKQGSEAEWMAVLAPYVEDGSYVEVSGEEDAVWRWVFNKGTLSEKDSVGIVWEDWEEIMRKVMTKNKELIPSFLGLDPALDVLLDSVLRGKDD